ncbi:MAG: hypothetical protein Q4B43_02955 [Bacteroidota bacterium]|nr:hypothetical protein [Bacteroidota bacterium]
MERKELKTLGLILLCAILLYIVHKYIVANLLSDVGGMVVSLDLIYVVFTLASIVLYVGLLFVAKKNYHYIGMGFLIGITLKMILFLIIFKPMLNQMSLQDNGVSKVSFIVVFFVFLLIDVVLGTKILKQYSKI